MFASKTPRDPNRDRPLRVVRHPFKLQHNEPNPILVAHRMYRDDVRDKGLDPLQEHLDELAPHLTHPGDFSSAAPGLPFTQEHIDHARRVLTRLANLAEKEAIE
jgi:hypothetical protein